MLDELLRARGVCAADERIPAPRFPFYSETRKCVIAEDGTSCTLDFEADRDLLIGDLSAIVVDAAGGSLGFFIDIEYCNITYAQHTFGAEFEYCCAGKPFFLVGVKEGKHLRVTITLAAPAPADGANVEVSLNGLQGNGCCP